MTHSLAVVAISLVMATPQIADRPAASDRADARYCLRVEPSTGSLVETVQCWTRAAWAEQGVDVDAAWAKDGVAVKR